MAISDVDRVAQSVSSERLSFKNNIQKNEDLAAAKTWPLYKELHQAQQPKGQNEVVEAVYLNVKN